MTTIITKERYEQAIRRFHAQISDVGGARATVRAFFRISDELTAELEATMLQAIDGTMIYSHHYEQATHIKLITTRSFPMHFFGKGARSSDAYYFQSDVAHALLDDTQAIDEPAIQMSYEEASRLAAEFNQAMME